MARLPADVNPPWSQEGRNRETTFQLLNAGSAELQMFRRSLLRD